MRKKSKIILITSLALALILCVGVTLAFIFKKAEADNSFIPAVVLCKVHENFDGAEHTEGEHAGNRKTEIFVENTGNCKAYVRVRLVSGWVDAANNPVGLSSVMPQITVAHADWLIGPDDTYYYAKPIEPGKWTENLCKPVVLSTSEDANGNTVYQTLRVFAEAIQAVPASAATQAWGVTVDENGIITDTNYTVN